MRVGSKREISSSDRPFSIHTHTHTHIDIADVEDRRESRIRCISYFKDSSRNVGYAWRVREEGTSRLVKFGGITDPNDELLFQPDAPRLFSPFRALPIVFSLLSLPLSLCCVTEVKRIRNNEDLNDANTENEISHVKCREFAAHTRDNEKKFLTFQFFFLISFQKKL